jgi:2-polyprenyl-6-methoxyphenol hydroxylase-like FAD-dependent oxidoreductase
MKALVIGGGIGGLATALTLHQAGIEAIVFESVHKLEPLGVGINLQPNAVRELTELGLGADLAACGIETSTLAYYNRHGQPIWSEPRGRDAGYRWPQYSIHRGDLLMLLQAAARKRLGDDRIRTGMHLVSFDQNEHGVRAQFADRHSGEARGVEQGDLLIAADGIHSAVRAQLYPGEGPPRYCGQTMWRAAVEGPAYLDGRTHVILGHRDCKFLAYPIRATAPGRVLVNWIAELTVPASERADWNRRVEKSKFAGAFDHWRFAWLDVAELIRTTHAVYEFPKIDRDPVDRWSFGRVTLVGDAAHPMLPIGSQAGSQAIVDPRHLVRALREESGIEAALRRYEAERLPSMNEVTLRIRGMGQEQVMELAERRAPDGFTRIEDVIPQEEMQAFAEQFRSAAGLDRNYVNERASLLGG